MASTIMESLFQRTLDDLVKGLRMQLIGEAKYIAIHLEEIRKEVKAADSHTKIVALQKLTYLSTLHGVDMEWAAFHVVEAMSMTKFSHKKVGYIAASCSFHEDVDVLLLITNQLRKDLASTNEYESGLALECLSCIATPDLARELTPQLYMLLASGKAYLRKRAIITFLKIFFKYPDAVRIAFKRLVEKLEDSDVQVISAAVTVLCEMAIKDPGPYLPLAPEFYRLLVNSKNNWLLIKVVKIFGVLASLEPRLGRKIADPLCDLMRKTPAKSLLLECIRTVIIGLPDHTEALKLAVEKLKELIEEDDPNLRYLGLHALSILLPAQSWAVAESKSVILRSLNDGDHSIQISALKLILGMVTDSNVIETVQVLLQYAGRCESSFCNELIGSILATCSRGLYEVVPDFSWYVSVLGSIARIPDFNHGKELERQLVDIGFRIKEVRKDLLNVARGILLDPTLLENPLLHRVLSAVAWIAGEYVEYSDNPYELIEALLQPRTRLLPSSVHAVYVQSVLKVFVHYTFLCVKGVLGKAKMESIVGGFSCMNFKEGSSYHSDYGSVTLSEGGQSAQADVCDGAALQLVNEIHETSAAHLVTGFGLASLNPQTNFTLETLQRMLHLLDSNVASLAQSTDVEVQERACNLFGVVKVFKCCLFSNSEMIEDSENLPLSTERAYETIKFLHGIFTHHLGPVSIFAQSRVLVPDGLVLEENLNCLHNLFSDEDTIEADDKGWYSGEFEGADRDVWSTSGKQSDGGASILGDSGSLGVQHRQWQDIYYLPVDKDHTKDDEYPSPIIAPLDQPSTSTGPDEILKLAEQSLLWTKPRHTKPRPVIVRLDDGDVHFSPAKTKKDLKANFISNAIRDVLEGDKSRRISSSKEIVESSAPLHYHHKSRRQSRTQGKVIQSDGGSQETPVSAYGIEVGIPDGPSSSKRKHKKHIKKTHAILEHEKVSPGGHGDHLHYGRRSRHRMKSSVSLSQKPIESDLLL